MIGYQYITLDDQNGLPVALHQTATRRAQRASGLVGLPPVRTDVRVRPARHGSIDRSQWTDAQLVTIEGIVTATVPGGEDALEQLHELATPLLDTLEQGAALLKWQEGSSGRELQRSVKLAAFESPQVDAQTPLIPWQVQLLAEDPRAYSQTLSTVTSAPMGDDGGGATFPLTFPVTFNAAGGGIASFDNEGNRSTPPVFRLFGGLTDPRVRLMPDGPEIVVDGTINAGDWLTIDVANRSVVLNDDPNIRRLHLIDFAESTWFDLPRGEGTVRLLATTADADAEMTVEYRSAYA